MNYAIEFLKQQKEIFYKEIKYTLNKDELKNINQKITDFNDALNKLTIPVVVKSFCDCEEEPSCRMQDNTYYCNSCDKEVK